MWWSSDLIRKSCFRWLFERWRPKPSVRFLIMQILDMNAAELAFHELFFRNWSEFFVQWLFFETNTTWEIGNSIIVEQPPITPWKIFHKNMIKWCKKTFKEWNTLGSLFTASFCLNDKINVYIKDNSKIPGPNSIFNPIFYFYGTINTKIIIQLFSVIQLGLALPISEQSACVWKMSSVALHWFHAR